MALDGEAEPSLPPTKVEARPRRRGGSPRTSPSYFGSGPLADGPAPKLLEPPVELAALAVGGLEPGPGSRDRWPYLVLSDQPATEIGPIDYRVQVPGYRPAEARLFARPVLHRLHEERVVLDPVAEAWGEIAVEIVGAPVARGLELPPDELVGAVRLLRPGDEPWIGHLPVGEYEAVFEAEDSGYETEPAHLVVTEGRQTLSFDLGDSGLFLLDLRAGSAPHDGRCALRIDDDCGSHFYATFERGPYLVPFLVPGSYRLAELDAPGCIATAPNSPFDVFTGELTVEIATCDEVDAVDPSR